MVVVQAFAYFLPMPQPTYLTTLSKVKKMLSNAPSSWLDTCAACAPSFALGVLSRGRAYALSFALGVLSRGRAIQYDVIESLL